MIAGVKRNSPEPDPVPDLEADPESKVNTKYGSSSEASPATKPKVKLEKTSDAPMKMKSKASLEVKADEDEGVNPDEVKMNPDENLETNVEEHTELSPLLGPSAASADTSGDELRDGSDHDDNSESIRRRKNDKFYWTFLIFWTLNVLLALTIYEVVSTPDSAYFAVLEIDPETDEIPLMLIPRERWDSNDIPRVRKTYIARRVVIVQTDSSECESAEECAQLMYDMEREQGMLQYNFVISKAGQVFEILGWNEPSSLFLEMPTMVVAFIGNYEDTAPTVDQLIQLKTLLSESEHLKYLDSAYTMIGRKLKVLPTALFKSFTGWKQWDCDNTDSDDMYVDFEPYAMYDDY